MYITLHTFINTTVYHIAILTSAITIYSCMWIIRCTHGYTLSIYCYLDIQYVLRTICISDIPSITSDFMPRIFCNYYTEFAYENQALIAKS